MPKKTQTKNQQTRDQTQSEPPPKKPESEVIDDEPTNRIDPKELPKGNTPKDQATEHFYSAALMLNKAFKKNENGVSSNTNLMMAKKHLCEGIELLEGMDKKLKGKLQTLLKGN